MEDAKTIELYWRRNETAIAETDKKYGAYCHTISYNILKIHEDAEECVSDTYQHAWETIPPERPGKLKIWLGVVVRNITIDLFRKNHAKKRYDEFNVLLSELDECIPSNESVEQIADAKALVECINNWLSELSSEDRNIFLRRYWYGEAVSTIAKSKGVSANTMTQKLYRMRNGLKSRLEKEGTMI